MPAPDYDHVALSEAFDRVRPEKNAKKINATIILKPNDNAAKLADLIFHAVEHFARVEPRVELRRNRRNQRVLTVIANLNPVDAIAVIFDRHPYPAVWLAIANDPHLDADEQSIAEMNITLAQIAAVRAELAALKPYRKDVREALRRRERIELRRNPI
jgi:hypothetical protein